MNLRRLLFVIRKEARQLRRDPRALRVAIVAPVIQLVLFGYAATTDLRDARLAVRDLDRGATAREFVDTLGHQHYFRVRQVADGHNVLLSELDSGRAQLALQIPPDFGRQLARGRAAPVQVLVDGSDSNTALTALGYLAGAVRAYSSTIALQAARRYGTAPLPILSSEPRVWYNPDLRSANYMLPGIVGLILLIITQNFTALSVVKERENGTLEQLVVTPLRPLELLIGKMVPIAAMAFVDAVFIVAISLAWFRVPLRGSLLLLTALSGGFVLCTLGTGVLISTVSRTQQQAQMTNFFLTFPAILLSGFIFPIANMPYWAQALSYLTPVRYFLVISRGIFLKGSGLSLLWPQAAALFGLGLLTLFTGMIAFRKRID